MAPPLVFNNQVYQPGFFGTDNGAAPTNATHSFGLDDTYDYPVTINGTIDPANGLNTVTITYTATGRTTPTTQTLTVTQYDNSNMILFIGTNGVPGTENGSTNRFVLSNAMMYGQDVMPASMRTRFADDGDSMLDSYAIACFVTGTNVRVVRDGIACDVAVETLAVGDLVVTASGAHRPIRWLGRRSYVGRFANRNPEVLPICFKAGSLGEGLPARDLWVSPKHAMFLNGALVAAEHLVNGVSVTKATRVDRVDYHHVELESHDVLLAEGAPSESFVDDHSRRMFHNACEYAELYPDSVRIDAIYCAPRLESGQELEAIRQRIDARADAVEQAA